MLIQSFLFATILLVGQALAQNGKCSGNRFFDSSVMSCQDCPTGSQRSSSDSTSCTCTNGLVTSSGQPTTRGDTCSSCPINSYFVSQKSGCNACPANSSNSVGSATSCKCNAGYSGGSVTTGSCTACPPNFFSATAGSTCTRCPTNSPANSSRTGCTCTNGEYNSEKNTCTPCSSNAELKDGKCVCKGNFFGDGNTCATCPANSMPNSDNTACQCSSSYPNAVGSGAQLTCTQCSSAATYNSGTKKCECANGFRHRDATSNQAAACINDMNGSVYYRQKKRAHEQIKMVANSSGHQIEISAFSARHARSCSRRQVACSLGRRGAFVCRDVLSDLEQCGACWDMPSTQDCTAIPGVDEVLCVEGKCVIKACDSKHSFKDGKCV